MAARRPLVDGLKTADPALEKEFVFGDKAKAQTAPQDQTPAPVTEIRESKAQAGKIISREPLTTRVRSDFASALKRASLQRQLDNVVPNSIQDILEEALEPWLRANGYLT